MTSTSDTNPQISQTRPHTAATRSRTAGGRQRAGGRGESRTEVPSLHVWGTSQSRGRGRGKGRGQEAALAEEHRRQLRAQLTGDATTTHDKSLDVPEGSGEKSEDESGDADVCFICASTVVHNALSPCNHRTCHICALRLRALYKTKACAHCRTNASYIIFTDTKDTRFEEFADSSFSNSDDNLGIKYEKPEIFEDTVLLLRYNCPDESCDVACLGWPDLHRHVRDVHHKVMCDLCTRNKKVFTHEHELFTGKGLRKHEQFGDDLPGTEGQTGFKGHPECGFCRQRFYGDDELYAHCREKHERCHICDRRDGGRSQQYYADYEKLELHFRKDHFLCPDRECLEKKFVVFEDKTDLNAHQLEEHPNGLSKEAKRDAQRVDMTGFSLREQYDPRSERRAGAGRGRGRHPDAEPLPQSTAQPLRRDELAFQRHLAIQSAQSVTNRTFGGQLSSASIDPRSSVGDVPNIRNGSNNLQPSFDTYPALNRLHINDTTQTTPETPVERMRRQRHQHVAERAGTLLRHDVAKTTQFRDRISAFKNSQITANELIDAFFTLFDTPSTELGKLIKELADIFEVGTKKQDLLRAWADWKAVNEDYPSLPGPSGAPAGLSLNPNATGSGGMRVLKLKSSTAQSGRSGLGRQGGWGSASSSGLNFPPLAVAAKGTERAKPSWWNSAAASSASSSTTADSRTMPTTRTSADVSIPFRQSDAALKVSNSEAFPALPATIKPTSTYFTPGSRGTAVRRDIVGWAGSNSTPTTTAWTVATSSTGGRKDTAAASEAVVDVPEPPKRKGKQGKKHVLMQFG